MKDGRRDRGKDGKKKGRVSKEGRKGRGTGGGRTGETVGQKEGGRRERIKDKKRFRHQFSPIYCWVFNNFMLS